MTEERVKAAIEWCKDEIHLLKYSKRMWGLNDAQQEQLDNFETVLKCAKAVQEEKINERL